MKWLFRFVKISIFLGVLGISSLVGFYFYIRHELPTEESIRDVRFQIPMKVFSADGELISQFGEKRRTPLLYKEIPQQLKDAILATEDSRFYDHYGIDPIGIFRAAFDSIILGKRARGASTITMQLARNAFLTLDRTLIRKIKEIFISIHIEQLLSKEEILTLYLNKTFFGNRAYGVGAAAQVYYGKEIHELTLSQFAMIAGLPKAPSNYNPIRRPERAIQRRNVVLSRMKTVGVITQAEYIEAKENPVSAEHHGADITVHAPYVAEEVRKFMVDKYGEEMAYTEGFNVYTTIDAHTQRSAQTAVIDNIHAYDERHGYRGVEQYLWQADIQQDEKTAEELYIESQQTKSEAQIANELAQKASDEFVGQSWDLDTISEFLDEKKNYNELVPAVVTNVTENSIYVQLKSGEIDVVDWDNLKWARKYISDTEQGKAPKTAHDILQEGALIWLKSNSDSSYRLSQIPEVSGAFIALAPDNGDIKAMVGGYNFVNNQFNRITQAKRQIGSNIKPFVYSAALERGYTLATLINDAPINKWDKGLGTAWRPKNSPPTYEGPTRVRRGLAQSKNVMAVRLARSVGINNIVEHLTKFGFDQADLPPNESLSLGSASLTPLSVARGMSAFANGGFLVSSQLIDHVKNAAGKVVYKQTKMVAGLNEDDSTSEFPEIVSENNNNEPIPKYELPAPRAITESNAFLIADAMKDTIWGGGTWSKGTGWNGTAWRAQKPLKRRDTAGKTGTTNSSVDTWFTGFTPKLLATSWVGFDAPGRALGRTSYNTNLDDTQTSGGESGAKTALPAWIAFMEKVLPNIPATYIEIPEQIISVRIDIDSGLLSRKTDYTTRFEYFEKGTEPQDYVDGQQSSSQLKDIIEEDDGIF